MAICIFDRFVEAVKAMAAANGHLTEEGEIEIDGLNPEQKASIGYPYGALKGVEVIQKNGVKLITEEGIHRMEGYQPRKRNTP